MDANKYIKLITTPVLSLETKLWNMQFREKLNNKWINLSFVKYDDAIKFYTLAYYHFEFLNIKNLYNINTEEKRK